MKRRKRLVLRQSLAYREGANVPGDWSVGYWDASMKKMPADQAFRVFGSKPTREEAEDLATQIAANRKSEFVF